MAGVELRTGDDRPAAAAALQVTKEMLKRGFIVLPEGEHSNVIGFTPPLIISRAQIEQAARALGRALLEIA